MIGKRGFKYTVIPLLVSLLLAACGPSTSSGSQLEMLVGDWHEDGGKMILRINAEGTYVIDGTGRLESDPSDSGTIAFDGKTLTFTSGEESFRCEDGDLWVWETELIDDERFRGVVTVDNCTDMVGTEWTWTSCIAEPLGDFTLCEPVK